MIGRIAELLHAGLELEQRVAKLVLRLDLGMQEPLSTWLDSPSGGSIARIIDDFAMQR